MRNNNAATEPKEPMSESAGRRIDIDPFSRAVAVIQSRRGHENLATATGFYWRHDDLLFLVSNWHVFSGRDANTGQPLSKHGGCPDHLYISAHILRGDGLSGTEQATLQIAKDEQPYWWEHPQHGQAVDVAVMPLAQDDKLKRIVALSDIKEASDMATYVGQDVFILGYPLDAKITGTLPIWKRGTIASEPNYPVSGQPKLLVDTLTRAGMSGAPVIARTKSAYPTVAGGFKFYAQEAHRNIGVYSGRLGADKEHLAQLAVVWRMELVDQICAGKKYGEVRLHDPATQAPPNVGL